jgi:hypothetical protein
MPHAWHLKPASHIQQKATADAGVIEPMFSDVFHVAKTGRTSAFRFCFLTLLFPSKVKGEMLT